MSPTKSIDTGQTYLMPETGTIIKISGSVDFGMWRAFVIKQGDTSLGNEIFISDVALKSQWVKTQERKSHSFEVGELVYLGSDREVYEIVEKVTEPMYLVEGKNSLDREYVTESEIDKIN